MEVDLPILGSPVRTSVEGERDPSKSWPSRNTESGTSDLWQARQSRSAEAELHIFGSLGGDEMRNFRSLAAKDPLTGLGTCLRIGLLIL